MTFSNDVKNEICSMEFDNLNGIAFLSGFIRNNIAFNDDSFSLITENSKVVRKLFSMLKDIYEINPEVIQGKNANFNKKSYYYLIVKEKINYILNDLNVIKDGMFLSIPSSYFIDSDDLARAYLAGCFVSCGSVNDPKKSRYHLEFFVNTLDEANYIISLFSRFNIIPKFIERDKGYMVYLKEAEKIGDFLRLISVNRAVMYYEDIRIYRDHKNMTNRLNNCEQANVDKIIASSMKQIEDINKIVNNLDEDMIDDKIKETMEYRVKYPESSLDELAKIISYETGKELTKSGLNHRLRKIHEIASKI